MRVFVVILALLLALVPVDTSAQAPGEAVQGVIADQIEAFEKGELERAFAHASPLIQGMFGTAENFGRMVEEGYPMVWRPAEVRFSGLAERGGRLVQTVLITDAAGRLYVADYEMLDLDGTWRINGVTLRAEAAAGV
jgi:hypothetical protein